MTATIVDGLKQLLHRRRDTVMYECRRCGTTLVAETEACPNCESQDVACYRL